MRLTLPPFLLLLMGQQPSSGSIEDQPPRFRPGPAPPHRPPLPDHPLPEDYTDFLQNHFISANYPDFPSFPLQHPPSAEQQLPGEGPGRGEWRMDSVECYDCHARMGSCNEGSCSGKACVKIEASVNERRQVTKGCTQLLEEPSCVRTDMGQVEALRCVCAYDHCNADDELARAGLAEGTASRASGVNSYAERPKRTQPSSEGRMSGLAPNYLVMLVFLSLFLTASFSLLIFNTVCVHLC